MILFLLIQENIVREISSEKKKKKLIILFFEVLSASSDATIKLWNAPKGTCMSTLRTHKVEEIKISFYFFNKDFFYN
jgi:WD40 repeat protein